MDNVGRVLREQRHILRRVAVEGLFLWAVLHGVLAALSAALRVSGMESSVRMGIVLVTGVLLWIDLRSSRDFLFHANLGLGGRWLLLAGLLPGFTLEVVLHALQVTRG